MSRAFGAGWRPILSKVRSPQDFVGGSTLAAIALFTFWLAGDLEGSRGYLFGPGTFPRLIAGLLLLLSGGLVVSSLLKSGPVLERISLRGPVFVTAAILLFSATIQSLGLVVASFLSFVTAALGTAETRWGEAIVVGLLLTGFCAFVFPIALGLPFQIWPRFLG